MQYEYGGEGPISLYQQRWVYPFMSSQPADKIAHIFKQGFWTTIQPWQNKVAENGNTYFPSGWGYVDARLQWHRSYNRGVPICGRGGCKKRGAKGDPLWGSARWRTMWARGLPGRKPQEPGLFNLDFLAPLNPQKRGLCQCDPSYNVAVGKNSISNQNFRSIWISTLLIFFVLFWNLFWEENRLNFLSGITPGPFRFERSHPKK